MLTARIDSLQNRAESIATTLSTSGIGAQVVKSEASVGGGAFPTARIESRAIAIDENPERIEAALRRGDPAVIGHIETDRLLLDMRSVMPAEDTVLSAAIVKAIS
jgi:L-seryl-tRNA(Ser) seleniumtransferase